MTINTISELPKNAKDLTGQVFGRLTVIGYVGQNKHRNLRWLCACLCGNIIPVDSGNLHKGNTKSCGCLHREQLRKRSTVHGMTGTQAYYSWYDMIRRCENPQYSRYKNWGGRGITVSEEFHDFQVWYNHIGPWPGPGYSQDRIDNEGNYEYGNIRWATAKEQANNQRDRKNQHWFFAFDLKTGEWYEANNRKKFAREHNLESTSISYSLSSTHKPHKDRWIFEFLPK